MADMTEEHKAALKQTFEQDRKFQDAFINLAEMLAQVTENKQAQTYDEAARYVKQAFREDKFKK